MFTVLAILSTICPFIINVIAQIINFSRTPKCWMISVSTTVIFYIVEVEWENTGFSYALSNISGKYRFCLICRGEAKFCEKINKINISTFFKFTLFNIIGIFMYLQKYEEWHWHLQYNLIDKYKFQSQRVGHFLEYMLL